MERVTVRCAVESRVSFLSILQATLMRNKGLPARVRINGEYTRERMYGMPLALVLAALAGAAMALQGSLNAALGKVLGWLEATLVVHVVGTVATAAALFLWAQGTWDHWRQAPWYTYLGGILGVLIIYGVVRSIPVVGVAAATTAILLAQIFCASLIDHLGLFGLQRLSFTWHRLLGSLLMAGGAWLLLKR